MSKLAIAIFLLVPIATLPAQEPKKNNPIISSSFCTRTSALEIIKQQIAVAKTIDDQVRRITVQLRAADLLWPYQQEQSLALFLESFDLATLNYKATGDELKQSSPFMRMDTPDQRFKVITALAKRDPARARKLSEQMLQDESRELEERAATAQQQRKVGEKLLTLGMEMIKTDVAAGVSFAKASFQYPSSLYLSTFLYELSKVNLAAADQFYRDALTAYRAAPMDHFLYLSAYPFGNDREAGDMPGYTIYRVPEGFTGDPGLQRLFVVTLLDRVDNSLDTPVDATSSNRVSDAGQMWLALTRLDSKIQQLLPDLSADSQQAKDKLYALLSPASQRQVTSSIGRDNHPKRSFDEQVEAAEKLSDVDRRDAGLTFAVTGASKDETVERVISVIDKISDSNIRGPLTNWFYFFRTQALIEKKDLVEARRLATRVTELDQRAYLFSRIAEKTLKENEDQTQVREMLNEIGEAAAKSPKTIVSARTSLALAYLYARLDINRGIEELGNAVKTINSLENPDFSMQTVPMKIEGKTFGSYAMYSTPGFNPETAFREIGKLDFDGTVTQASDLTEKSLRSLTTLAVVEPCLSVAAKPAVQKKKP